MKKTKRQQNRVSMWQLFLTFLKVGAFTFGGGYAMITILEEELVTKKKWITSDDMLDMLVIAESTPGVIAVNTATSVGLRVRGVLGAFLATLGVVLPSFLIIFGLSFAIQAFQDNTWYKAAFTGIQACVTVLIVNAFIKMAKQINRDVFSFVLLAAAFAVATFTGFDVIYLILIGGVLGIIYTVIRDAVLKKKAEKTAAETSNEVLSEVSDETTDTAGGNISDTSGGTRQATSSDINADNGGRSKERIDEMQMANATDDNSHVTADDNTDETSQNDNTPRGEGGEK